MTPRARAAGDAAVCWTHSSVVEATFFSVFNPSASLAAPPTPSSPEVPVHG